MSRRPAALARVWLALAAPALVASGLAGCAGMLAQRTATTEAVQPAATVVDRQPPASAAEVGKLAEQVARVAGELGELQNALAKLAAAARQQESELQFLRRRLDDLAGQVQGRAGSPPRGFAPAPPTAPPAAVTSPTTVPAEDLYREALEKHRAKDLDAAVLMLYDLIVTYPNHPLRESAQFLVADIFYGQKDYRGALAEFEALLAAVPAGTKVADTLLKIGLSQRALGDTAAARRSWERVVREFPASVAARQARVLLGR